MQQSECRIISITEERCCWMLITEECRWMLITEECCWILITEECCWMLITEECRWILMTKNDAEFNEHRNVFKSIKNGYFECTLYFIYLTFERKSSKTTIFFFYEKCDRLILHLERVTVRKLLETVIFYFFPIRIWIQSVRKFVI